MHLRIKSKWLFATLSLCLAAGGSLLSGCGGKEKSKGQETASAQKGAESQSPNGSTAGQEKLTESSTQPEQVAEPPKVSRDIPHSTEPKGESKKKPSEAKVANGNQLNGKDDSQVALDKLSQLVDKFQVPPVWLKEVKSEWDVAEKPWKEARLEIRRLLGVNTEEARKEGIKLTWDYLQKGEMGDQHEYGMYLFLGGEPIWAVIAYRERLARTDLKYPPFFGVVALASLYSDHGAYEAAEKVLLKGVKMRPPQKAWYEMREAEMHDALGDLYADWGRMDQAKASYREAIRLYPLGKPPYGRHLLPRRAKKVQAKLDLLSAASLASTPLNDGTYNETALGYSGDIKLSVHVASGKITKIDVQHQEKIDQNACKVIPRRIVEKQSLNVDGISGATVTKDAIVAGTLRALRKAGLN